MPPDAPKDVPPDVPPLDVCLAKTQAFTAARTKSLACANFWECYGDAPEAPSCPCKSHVNGTGVAAQNVYDVESEWKKAGCKAACSTAPCKNLDVTVGVCATGQCQTQAKTCKEIENLAFTALAEGAKCKADADCTFKVSNAVGCGCATFVNTNTMGPGKPLFYYMLMLAKVYKNIKCVTDIQCACPNPNSAKCVAGMCKF